VDSNVTHNTATGRGGAFYSASGHDSRRGASCTGSTQKVKLTRTSVSYNYAWTQGGGLFLWNVLGEADGTSEVRYNAATDGGGVSLVGMFSNFIHSTDGDGGGATATGGVDQNMANTSPDVDKRFQARPYYTYSLFSSI